MHVHVWDLSLITGASNDHSSGSCPSCSNLISLSVPVCVSSTLVKKKLSLLLCLFPLHFNSAGSYSNDHLLNNHCTHTCTIMWPRPQLTCAVIEAHMQKELVLIMKFISNGLESARTERRWEWAKWRKAWKSEEESNQSLINPCCVPCAHNSNVWMRARVC